MKSGMIVDETYFLLFEVIYLYDVNKSWDKLISFNWFTQKLYIKKCI